MRKLLSDFFFERIFVCIRYKLNITYYTATPLYRIIWERIKIRFERDLFYLGRFSIEMDIFLASTFVISRNLCTFIAADPVYFNAADAV